MKPADFQSASSLVCVPDLSPRLAKVAAADWMLRNASFAVAAFADPAGSAAGPTMTKSLYITSSRRDGVAFLHEGRLLLRRVDEQHVGVAAPAELEGLSRADGHDVDAAAALRLEVRAGWP